MSKGWLAAAMLVVLGVSGFYAQQERPQQSGERRPMSSAGLPGHAQVPEKAPVEAVNRQDEFLQAGLEPLPDRLLADARHACALDNRPITQTSLTNCYQARLAANTDKDFRFWAHVTYRLRSSGRVVPQARAQPKAWLRARNMLSARQELPLG